VFKSFTGNQPEMDGRTFVKVCKDCNLYDKKFTQTNADLIFTKIKDRQARKITYAQFESALKQVAELKKVPFEDVLNQVTNASGPIYTGTKMDEVRFYDDKNLYTGVHAHGGPSIVDTGRVQFGDLSEMCDRSSANVRGVKEKVMANKTGDSK